MTKQKTKFEMYYTTIEGKFKTFMEVRDYYKMPKSYFGVQNAQKVKRWKYLNITQHIIKGSEPLLEYKWHPKFTDYCIDIEGNVFRYSKEYGFKEIIPYINVNEKLGVNSCNDKGYATIQPYIGTKRHIQYHHRMVAEAWIPNPNNFRCVNHLNEKKWDNRVENLEWTTYRKNSYYSKDNIEKGRQKARENGWGSKPKLRKWKVFQFYKDGKFVAEHQKLDGLAKLVGLPKKSLQYIRYQKDKVSNNYHITKYSNIKIKKVWKEEWYT